MIITTLQIGIMLQIGSDLSYSLHYTLINIDTLFGRFYRQDNKTKLCLVELAQQ